MGTSLRINFDYNFAKTLRPFEKEPPLEGKETARGLIPTVPTTPFIRNITEGELYLNENHGRDFTIGKPTTHTSTYDGHVRFRELHVSTDRDGVLIPYTVNMWTYEHGCAGWLVVESAWQGDLALDGRLWRLGVVDNLDGRIDDKDLLYLCEVQRDKAQSLIVIQPLPQTLYFAGHVFSLSAAFEQSSGGVIVEATLSEQQLPLGQLDLEAKGCKLLRLQNDRTAVILEASNRTVSLPVGDYRLVDCILDQAPDSRNSNWVEFESSDQRIVVRPGRPAHLRAGLPLRNTVVASHDRDLLRVEYELLGIGGERYRCHNGANYLPCFRIFKGPVPAAYCALPFG
jgi:hypothetical protein